MILLEVDSENARDTKNLTTIITTCHMDSYECWMLNGGSTSPLLITLHVANYRKNCEIFCIFGIAFSVKGSLN